MTYELSEAVTRKCSVKKNVLRILEKFTVKHLRQSLLFNKVVGWGLQLYHIKNRLLHKCFPGGLTSEFCEISKKTFSYRTTPAAAS